MNKLAPFFVFGLILISCNRKGCADPFADNYDPKVKKAHNEECTYNGIPESPCGDQIEFCAKLDNANKSGEITLTNGTNNSIILVWQDTTGTNNESLEIEIFKPQKGNFTADGSFNDGTFTVLYSDGQTSQYDVNGSMKITDYNSEDGLSATFSSELTNGKKFTNGFLHRVK